MSNPIIPECTKDAKDCVMCDMIRQIFEGFPTEQDPGCELGEGSSGENQDRVDSGNG